MSKPDAERALNIYKTFTKQTNIVVEFLSTARQYENATRLEIPKLKHAPTSLTSSLEEYLNDPDFEINRRQYLAQQDARKGRKASAFAEKASSNAFSNQPANKGGTNTSAQVSKPSAPVKQEPKGPAPDLIDFFDSIEQNQQTMATQPQAQQPVPYQASSQQTQQQAFQPSTYPSQQAQNTGFPTQQLPYVQNGQPPQAPFYGNATSSTNSNPFGPPQQIQQQPVQTNYTGAGFGGYSPQPASQSSDIFSTMSQDLGSNLPAQQKYPTGNYASFQQPQQQTNTAPQSPATNPFRQSAFPSQITGSTASYNGNPPQPLAPQSTNPFARTNTTGFSSQTPTSIQSAPFSSTQFTGITTNTSPFTAPSPPQQPQSAQLPPSQFQQQQQQQHQSITPQKTGTNPFTRSNTLPANHFASTTPSAGSNGVTHPLIASPTGSTNPFRQSAFVKNTTGWGWQAGQGTMGGLEQLETMPVFPRPGQTQPGQLQQQHQQSFWS